MGFWIMTHKVFIYSCVKYSKFVFHCFCHYLNDAVETYDFSSMNSSTLTFKTKLESAIHYIVCSMFNGYKIIHETAIKIGI